MEKNELINDIRISIQDAHSIMKVLEHLASINEWGQPVALEYRLRNDVVRKA